MSKTVLKDKALSAATTLPENTTANAQSSQSTAYANVTARLYNSNPVKEASKEALAGLRAVLGIEVESTQAKRQRLVKDREPDKPVRTFAQAVAKVEHDKVDEEPVLEQGMSGSDEEAREDSASVDLEDEDASDEWDELSLDEEALNAFDDRLAGSSDEGSDDGDKEVRRAALRRDLAGNLSLSPESSPSPVPEPASKSKVTKDLQNVRAKTDFLPSLTMGGYWSGSESEPEDDIDVAPRKNRRGQRARQQIWEKKYGKGAKHIQNGKTKTTPGRDDGWDMKRGAQESGKERRAPGFGRTPRPRGDIASGGNATAVAPRAQTKPDKASIDSKPLHPSWEAAKKAKEQKQTATFAGKKMTFD